MFYHPKTKTLIREGFPFEIEGTQYPSNWLNISTQEDKLDHGIYELFYDPRPDYSEITHTVIEGTIESRSEQYYQTWTLLPLSEDAVTFNIKRQKDTFQHMVVQSVQQRLDEFARTRNYDSIQSLANYAGDEDTIFNSEGTYGKSLRSRTWRTLYNILADVEAGNRSIPTMQEILLELPNMEWPA